MSMSMDGQPAVSQQSGGLMAVNRQSGTFAAEERRLADALEIVEGLVQTLYEVADQFLRPAGPETPDDRHPVAEVPRSQVAAALAGWADRLEGVGFRLGDITSRIDQREV